MRKLQLLSLLLLCFSVNGLAQSSKRGKGRKTKKNQTLTFSKTQKVLDYFSLAQGWNTTENPVTTGDLNGDKHIDLIGFDENGVFAAYGNGDGTFQVPTYVLKQAEDQGKWDESAQILLADINSDNRADLLIVGKDGVYATLSTNDLPMEEDGDFSPPNTMALAEIIGKNAKAQKIQNLIQQDFSAIFRTISSHPTMLKIFSAKIKNAKIDNQTFEEWWMGNSVTESELIVASYFDKLINSNPQSEEYKVYHQFGRQQLVTALNNRSLTVSLLQEMTALTDFYYESVLEEVNGIADYTVLDNLKITTMPSNRAEFRNLIVNNSLNLMGAISGPFAPIFKSASTLQKIILAAKEYDPSTGASQVISGSLTNNEIKAIIRAYRKFYQDAKATDKVAVQTIRKALLKDATLMAQFAEEHNREGVSKDNRIRFANNQTTAKVETSIKLNIRKRMLDAILPIAGKLYGIRSYIEVPESDLLKGNNKLRINVPRPKGAEDILAFSTYRGKSRYDKDGRRHNWYLALGGQNNFGDADGIPILINRENNADIWQYVLEAYDNRPSEILKKLTDKYFPNQINGSNFYYHTHVNQIYESAFKNDEDVTKKYMGYFEVPGKERVLPDVDAGRIPMIVEPSYWFIYNDKVSNKKLPVKTRVDFEVKIASSIGAGTDSKIGVKLKYHNGVKTTISKMDLLRSDMRKGSLENNYFFVNAPITAIEEIRLYSDGSGRGSELNIESIAVTVNKIKLPNKTFSLTYKNPKNKGLEGDEMLVLKRNGSSYTKKSNLTESQQKQFDKME